MKTKNNPKDELRAETFELINTIYDKHVNIYTNGLVNFKKAEETYFNDSNRERLYAPLYKVNTEQYK